MKQFILILLFCAGAFAEVPALPFSVIRSIPHDRDAFTQGLVMVDNMLWESTGTPGGGTRIRQIDPATGEVIRSTNRDAGYFGEGLASDGIMLYQLSWQQQLLHIFTYPTIEKTATVPYRGEGWGLTMNSSGRFLMSNGSDTIVTRNSQFKEIARIPVTMNGSPVKKLNELEWHNGSLYANVWYSDSIVVIDPETGTVTGVIDLSGLRKECGALSDDQVVNGIAAAGKNRFWVTGKFWPKIYLIELP